MSSGPVSAETASIRGGWTSSCYSAKNTTVELGTRAAEARVKESAGGAREQSGATLFRR
jgi:hypothetical protein